MEMKKSEKTKGKERAAAGKKRKVLTLIAGASACIVIVLALWFVLNPAVVQAGDKVSVSYVGTLDNGSVFDSNVNRTPLSFTVGGHTVIPGFENAVLGMKKGEVKTVRIPPDEAYGVYRNDLVYTVNRTQFSADTLPQAGMYFTVTSPSTGQASRVKIVNVTDSAVTIDANHMLAGENLTFVIRLLEIS